MDYNVTPEELIKFIKSQPPERPVRFDQSIARVNEEPELCGCLQYQFLLDKFPKASSIICGVTWGGVVIRDPYQSISIDFPYRFDYFGRPATYEGLQAMAASLHPEIFQSV